MHFRFLLWPTDVQPVAICLILCRVVRSRDFSATAAAPGTSVGRVSSDET